MKNTFIIPVAIGEHLPRREFQLGAGLVPIAGVTVDNANSHSTVKIWPGSSPNGIPYIVAPGRSISIAMDGPFMVFAEFDGSAKGPDEVIYISVSSEAGELFTTNTVGFSPGSMVAIDTSGGPVQVEIPGGVPLNPPGFPPAGAVISVKYDSNFSFTAANGADRIQINPGPGLGTPQTWFYLVMLITEGFWRAPYLNWIVQGRNSAGAYVTLYTGWNDRKIILPINYMQFTGNQTVQGIFFRIQNYPSIIGTFTGHLYLVGYYAGPPPLIPPADPEAEEQPDPALAISEASEPLATAPGSKTS